MRIVSVSDDEFMDRALKKSYLLLWFIGSIIVASVLNLLSYFGYISKIMGLYILVFIVLTSMLAIRFKIEVKNDNR